MQVALDQLAERGKEGVTLRELTDAAGANVAAVSYHFGSWIRSATPRSSTLSRSTSTRTGGAEHGGPESTLEELADVSLDR